jgi:FkbM family methyltransferase
MSAQLNAQPNLAHRVALGGLRIAARPFAGTRLGSAIVRRVPAARQMYYALYGRISKTLLDVNTPVGPLTVDLRDRSVGQKLYLGRDYERRERELMSRVIAPGMTVFDVGAHVGYYTRLASSIVGERGRVVAFEPDPHNCELLVQNVRRSGLRNVEVVNVAVGASERSVELFRDPDWAGDHRTHAVAGREAVTVQCTSLDAYCASGIRPDVLKIDVQGAEGEVFAGMRRLLAEAPPRAVFAEFWPRELAAVGTDPAQLVESMCGAGYKPYEVGDERTVRVDDIAALVRSLPGEQDYTNLLFVRRDQGAEWLA